MSTQQQPEQSTFDERAPVAKGVHIALDRGCVQYIGRRDLDICETRMTISIPDALAIASQLLALLLAPTPEGAMVRAVFGAPRPISEHVAPGKH